MGKELTTAGLTDKQAAWVRAVVQNGGQVVAAAREAGYEFPEQETPRLQANPRIQAALHAERSRALANMANLALRVQQNILDGTEPAPASVKAQVAESVLERAGHHKKTAETDDSGNKSLEGMTPAALDAFIKQAEEELAKAQADLKDVTPDNTESGPLIDGQAIEE